MENGEWKMEVGFPLPFSPFPFPLPLSPFRNPWAIRIERGRGQVMGQGAVKMVGDPEASISILLPDWHMRSIALRILDYIRAWEIVNWPAWSQEQADQSV